MSKQLAISASFSILAMAAFALFATQEQSQRLLDAPYAASALPQMEAAAPTFSSALRR